MDSIILKVRYLIGDNLTTVDDVFTYDTSAIFTLSESNISTITDVYRNDISSGVTHTYSSTTKKVTVSSSLTAGDTIKIEYTCYQNYSDTELTAYIQAALIHLSINNYYNFEYDSATDAIYPTPESKEENLIALVTSILINPDNRSIRLPDLSIGVPNDLPTDQKISKTISKFKHDTHGVFDILY
jgi:hypothetical protein